MKLALNSIYFVVLLTLAQPLAGQVCFDFTGGESSPHFLDLDQMKSASTTIDGVTATITAVAVDGVPELNFDGTDGLGVNITENVNDEDDKLDAGVTDESMDFVFDSDVVFQDILIDGMGWTSSTDYEYVDVFLNGAYYATLLDTDADAATTALHTNPVVGAASDTFLGLNIELPAGDTIRFAYFEAGANNGCRIEKIAVEPDAGGTVVVAPVTAKSTRGVLASGGPAELANSDNVDLAIRRSSTDIQSRTEFEVTAVSPTDQPSSFDITVEGSVFARLDVNQTIELFDYSANVWEEVDTRAASRFIDASATVSAAGVLSRFIEPGTLNIRARVRFNSPNPRQQFTSNTDHFFWEIGQ